MDIKKLKITNAIIIVAILIFVIAGWFLTETNVFIKMNASNSVVEPEQVTEIDGGQKIYRFNTVDLGKTTSSLSFYTNHQEVYVYADNILIYSCEKSNSIFSHSTGSVMNLVEIPYGTRYLVVILKPVFPDVIQDEIEFSYGNGVYIYDTIIQRSVYEMIICLLVLGMGICLVVYYYLLGTRKNNARDVLHLGVFSLILGAWIIGETKGAMLIIHNRPIASYTAFTCLMLVPIPFMYFIRYFMNMKDKYFHIVLLLVNICFVVVLQTMQFTNYRELRENSLYCQLPIFISFTYYFYAIFSNLKKREMKNRITINLIGGVIMISLLIVDMAYYYFDRSRANRFGKFGFLIYIILLGAETARGAKARLEEERKNDLYREMAVKDMLTECYNRNALKQDIEDTVNARGCYVLNFDLNNLKLCNDNLGHKEGDKYLMGSAKLICTTFGKYGKVYRIGGDEFCVITHNIDCNKVEELIAKMRANSEKFYVSPAGYDLGIAVGYAKYDPLEDRSLADTAERADESMYEDKKRIKKEQRTREKQALSSTDNNNDSERKN